MKSIVFFLACTFLMTYLFLGSLAYLTSQDILDFSSFLGQTMFILGGSSPTIFAFIFILRNASDSKKKDFYLRLLSFRHQPIFWLFALLIPLVLGATFQLAYFLVADEAQSSLNPFYFFFMLFFVSIIFGGLEEIGWRGYLQEKLMQYNIPLIPLSIGIGLIWGLWHIPLFFIAEVSHYQFAFIPFLLGAIMFGTYLTWLYSQTRSILLVVVFHASINASASIGLGMLFMNSFLSYFLIIILTLIGFTLLHFSKNKDYPRAVQES